MASIHHDPTNFFPNEGFVEEIGTGAGQGYAVRADAVSPAEPVSSEARALPLFRALS